MDSNPPSQNAPMGEATEEKETAFKTDSLLDRLKSKIPDTTHLTQSFLIPGLVVATVLFVGVGGTYIVASNFLSTPSEAPTVSKISQQDLANANITAPTPTFSPTLLSSTPSPTPVQAQEASPSATPTPTLPPNWTAYNFGVLNLNFSYPQPWNINVPSTSGAPYLYVQNFAGNTPTVYTPGQYAILIERLEQVGITSVSALTTQLAQNAASNLTLGGVNVGQVTVVSSTPITVNGYNALKRIVTYSSSPSAQMTEIYVLDGKVNVVEFVPFPGDSTESADLDTLLSTVKFTN